MKVKELPGAPWDENYVATLLGRYDVVIANGYEYTSEDKRRTERAQEVLSGE